MESDAEIAAFARSFEDGSLPASVWTHGRHLVMALWYLLRYPRAEATDHIRLGIRRDYQARGNAAGYHETITLAWVAVISRFLADRGRDRPVPILAGELLAECGDTAYLLRFYSRDVLQSEEARARWVPPDLAPIEGPPGISYQIEDHRSVGEAAFLDLLARSGLDVRRPVGEPATIRGMLEHADVLATARLGPRLVGISRAITDFSYCTYLSDLAVDREHQRLGIGRELIRRTHEAAGLHTTLILLAAPAARDYYPHVGLAPHDSCWIIPRRPRTG